MTATLEQPDGATGATPAALLDFVAIKKLAGERLGVAAEDVTDGALAGLFGLDRGTIWRFRHGTMNPRFETVSDMADALGVPVDSIRAKGNPSPPRPASPSTPRPPAAPKPKAA